MATTSKETKTKTAKAAETTTASAKTVEAAADKKTEKATEAAETKTTAKKTTATKTAAKASAATKKTTAKKEELKTSVAIQFAGKEIFAENLLEEVKKAWVEQFEGKLADIKTIELYIKPEEAKAYFVVNGLSNGNYFINL